jgi:UDP-N-acetyl-D-mannosaminuronic acid dehydrogenase/UDP-N-acetyl-D-glucosamine dehydrogenase
MTTGGRLAVIGQGYVGLPLSMRAVQAGYEVVGIEVDHRRAHNLASGTSYVEDVSDEVLAAALATGRYSATTDYSAVAEFDVAVITVPTPLREGLPDLSFVEDAGRSLAKYITPGATVILESTTYPGTTEELLQPILERGSGLAAGAGFHLGYSPERIDPGNATYNFQNTPKVVSGIDEQSGRAIAGFYASIIDTVVPVSGTRVAELTKLLENTFRHVNIALVNELAMFAHDLGIDVWEAIDASSTKPFGYMRFTPGPGVGGHCLPIDPSYLSWDVKRRLGTPFRFVELANDINEHMPRYVVQRVTEILNDAGKSVKNSAIVLLGLAYKKNTSDARESPAVRVAELLLDLGARVQAVDPHVPAGNSPICPSVQGLDAATVADSDLVILLTDHDDIDYSLLASAPRVLDTRHVLKPAANVISL